MREKIGRLPTKNFEVAQARLMRKDALSWMVRHPLQELTLIPRKLVYLNLGDSRAIQVGVTSADRARALDAPVTGGITPVITDNARAAVLIGTIADIAWYGLLALTALALVVLGRELWRRPASRAAIVVIALALVLYGFVFYGNFRYRLPLEPLMILLAVSLLATVWEARRRLRDSIAPGPADSLPVARRLGAQARGRRPRARPGRAGPRRPGSRSPRASPAAAGRPPRVAGPAGTRGHRDRASAWGPD